MKEGFYRAFEDRFRGTRKDIRSRLKAYEPVVKPLAKAFKGASVIDIGCGRGEWLELMDQLKFKPLGIDLDDGMLEVSRDIEMEVICGDGIEHLKSIPAGTLAIVSAFHVVEHINFDVLNGFIEAALRALKPGGVLIMETPNPENIAVGTQYFYMDPSHLKPIPAPLLAFLSEYLGFARVKVVRLNGRLALTEDRGEPKLIDVIDAVSPDYAVVAQKDGKAEIFDVLDGFFSGSYGYTLEQLAGEFDNKVSTACLRAEEALMQASQSLQLAHESIAKAEIAREEARRSAHRASNAEYEAHQNEIQLLQVYSSLSWRITKPLRVVSRILSGNFVDLHRLGRIGFAPLRYLLRPLARAMTRELYRETESPKVWVKAIRRIPMIHERFLGILPNTSPQEPPPTPPSLPTERPVSAARQPSNPPDVDTILATVRERLSARKSHSKLASDE